MELMLMLINGDEKGKCCRIDEHKSCSIGRDPSNTVAVPDKLVSKHHAVVSCVDGALTIEDLGAANGTFVNGCRVTVRRLAEYDNITIGMCVFRVVAAAGGVAGSSIVSLDSDVPVIGALAPVPAGGPADATVPGLVECIRGMQSIMERHSNDIVRESLKYIFRIIPVTRIAVFNVKPDGGLAQGYTVCRRAEDNPAVLSRTFAQKVVEAGKALLIRDAEELKSRSLDASIGFKGVHCIAGLPIVIQGRISAVLLGDNLEEPDILNDGHLRIMQFAGRAIEVLYQRDAAGKLEGLVNNLPVCGWCKRIRDDQGYWNQLESFVAERVAVRLAKGCCPECAENVIGS